MSHLPPICSSAISRPGKPNLSFLSRKYFTRGVASALRQGAIRQVEFVRQDCVSARPVSAQPVDNISEMMLRGELAKATNQAYDWRPRARLLCAVQSSGPRPHRQLRSMKFGGK
jgi:hypothetical protein